MADLKRTIEILFEGTNRTGTAISGVGRDLDKLNYSVSSVASPLASVTTAVAKLDAVLVAMAAAGIAYSVDKFADFEDVMLKVKGIMGASQDQYVQLTALTKELGATTRYTATEAAQGLEFLAMAGFSFEDSMAALPTTLQLAQASATGLGQTADILTNIMAGYGIAIDDLAATSDVLTATFTSSNTNLTQLGQAFKYVGPVAKSLGLDIEETAAILGTLGNAGYQAEQGGTALRNILIALIAPAGNAGKLMKELGVDTSELGVDLASSAEALKSLGVTVKDSAGNLRPFAEIMDDLKVGLQKIQDPADRSAVLIEIFGKRGGPQMAALLEQGGAAVSGLESKIRSLGGVTASIADQMESGIGGALRVLRSSLEAAALSIGDNFGEGLIDPIRSLADVFRALSFSIDDGAFDPVFDAFAGFGEDLGAELKKIAENLPEALEQVDFQGLLDALGGIGDEIGRLFDGLDFDKPEDLAEAIQRVVDSLESLANFSKGIAGVFISLAKEVGGMIDKFNDLDAETKASMGSISGIGSAVKLLTAPIGQATQAIKGMGLALNVIAGGTITSAAAAHPVVASIVGIGVAAVGVVKGVDMLVDKLHDWIGTDEKLEEANRKALAETDQDIARIYAEADKVGPAFEDMGESIKKSNLDIVNSMDSAQDGTSDLTEKMRELGILVEEKKTVEVDISDAVKKFETLEYWRESTGTWETIKVPVDVSEVEKAKKEIEEVPAVKRLEIETDFRVEELKAKAETAQAALKFKAEVDIAEIQAAAEVTTTLSNNITEMFSAAGDTISSLFSTLGDAGSISEKWAIKDAIEAQQENQDRTLKMQEQLTKAQVDYLTAKTDAMEAGEALITVNGDGLAPELEMIMWKVFEAIQIQATQEGLDQLLLGGAAS